MSRRDPVPMGEEEWRDLEAAFEEASRLQGEALDAFLHELASRKPRLAEEVASMLAAAAASGETRFASPELAPGLAPGGAEETWLGRDVGPFRIEALIGEGGMGRVFLAERREGFSQTVAVKMLRGAMEGTVFARRFLRERATLARLNHPHIAGLVDGGALEDGTPWLAMEHVSGRTLLEHCEEAGLGLPARVDLLIQVVDALQFAHQQLVVHRDVKPSNILVATGEHAMLLDFGISKLLEEGPEEGEELTLPQAPLYTPEYASPEQMRGEAVGTTSDIYAAGVVLFRLASGRLPFDGEGVTRFEWTRMVSEQDAPPLRSVAPRAPRDLEAIVARCLARE
ncbi:MAG: serine/threonine-protein kinase, partial [Planctomycetota bacterium]